LISSWVSSGLSHLDRSFGTSPRYPWRSFVKDALSDYWVTAVRVQQHTLPNYRTIYFRLLQAYADIFAEPRGLPPPRRHDHRIHLLPDTTSVVVRPYRYPQLLKDEVERQCQDMLGQGIIRPSTSPFSASVLLVKKSDTTWRFCVDYRALNDKTVKDKFPIPVVDELLDELHGAQFFTKIDLHSGYHQVCMHPEDKRPSVLIKATSGSWSCRSGSQTRRQYFKL
jgi:hypothetical protein